MVRPSRIKPHHAWLDRAGPIQLKHVQWIEEIKVLNESVREADTKDRKSNFSCAHKRIEM
uniref:Uncharacterized protein n=1 Tax=Ascaris lumbricoides TaxID=6252 RepID=A0A9J2Q8H2_ASCLU